MGYATKVITSISCSASSALAREKRFPRRAYSMVSRYVWGGIVSTCTILPYICLHFTSWLLPSHLALIYDYDKKGRTNHEMIAVERWDMGKHKRPSAPATILIFTVSPPAKPWGEACCSWRRSIRCPCRRPAAARRGPPAPAERARAPRRRTGAPPKDKARERIINNMYYVLYFWFRPISFRRRNDVLCLHNIWPDFFLLPPRALRRRGPQSRSMRVMG